MSDLTVYMVRDKITGLYTSMKGQYFQPGPMDEGVIYRSVKAAEKGIRSAQAIIDHYAQIEGGERDQCDFEIVPFTLIQVES